MKIAEIGFSIFLFIIALFMFIVGLSYPYNTDFGPGPGFAPVWVSGLMVVLTLFLTINLLRKEMKGKFFSSNEGLKNLLYYIGLVVVVVALVNIIGLIIGLAIFCAIVFKFIDKYRWKQSLLVAFGTALVLYLTFNIWLNIPVPTGLLF